MKSHCLRLNPGDDLKISLKEFAEQHNIKAAAVLTCVGSLLKIHLRMAGAKERIEISAKHEILSLVGTLSDAGLHLHLSASDRNGRVIGGHLLDGNIVNTTAEIILAEIRGYEFIREHDEKTGYEELKIVVQENQ